MGMFDKLIENLKQSRKTIVFTEGEEIRILKAVDRLVKEDMMGVILCGNEEKVRKIAEENGCCIEGCTILDPLTYPEMDEMVALMAELRKGKMTEEECRELLKKSNYFGTMLVKMGKADCLLGGATYSTADTVRPALQIVKTKKGSHLVSSTMILYREKDGKEETYVMSDPAINVEYKDKLDKDGNVVLTAAQQLAEIAVETAKTAEYFGIDPKVAVLSFSTYGSGKGGLVQLSHDTVGEARKLDPELVIDGEFQFDAAFSEEVAKVKCPSSPVAGKANVFIFPLLEACNIGYKIGQRLGGFEAYGPILQGLNAPINDLSRGCTAEEVYMMALITGGMA